MRTKPTRREFLIASSAAAMGVTVGGCVMTKTDKKHADLILHNGKITTLDPKYPDAQNIAIKDGRIVGVDDAESYARGADTRVIDLKNRRVIPGLNDSHTHVIRGGLSYNL
jgi:predicted amidohydrolase YtcJ